MTTSEEVGPNTFTGRGVNVFQARTIASGLRLYAKTGMKPNRAYTPSNMVKAARSIVGPAKIGARDYEGWAKALTDWADQITAQIKAGEATD